MTKSSDAIDSSESAKPEAQPLVSQDLSASPKTGLTSNEDKTNESTPNPNPEAGVQPSEQAAGLNDGGISSDSQDVGTAPEVLDAKSEDAKPPEPPQTDGPKPKDVVTPVV